MGISAISMPSYSSSQAFTSFRAVEPTQCACFVWQSIKRNSKETRMSNNSYRVERVRLRPFYHTVY